MHAERRGMAGVGGALREPEGTDRNRQLRTRTRRTYLHTCAASAYVHVNITRKSGNSAKTMNLIIIQDLTMLHYLTLVL